MIDGKAVELTAEDSAVISDLQRHQTELGLGQEEFARRYLSKSSTVWTRICSGDYWRRVADSEPVMSALRMDLRNLEAARLLESRYGAVEFIEHPEAAQVLKAVRQARVKPISDDVRLVVYLAPSGGGKSAVAGRIRADGGRIVEARQSWLRSYWVGLCDIARACGINTKNFYSPAELEDELIRRLNSRRQTLVIDEGEFFSAATLNLVKLILNKTSAVIVICALPEAFDRWSTKNWHEAVQIRRRTHALVRLAPCDEDTARMFLKPIKCDTTALKVAAAFAREFAPFLTLVQMRAQLDGEDSVDRDAMIKAGNLVRRCQGLPSLFTER